MKNFLLLPVLTLAGCASHSWTPGPGQSVADFEPQKARCSLMARNGGSGFAASGSTSFVAGAAIGAAIGNAIKAQSDFNDCMVASGWQVADQTTAQADHVAEVNIEIKTASDVMKACVANIRNDDKFTPISSHFPDPDTGKFSMEQLSDTSVPTNDEAKLIAQYYDEVTECRRPAIDKIVQLVPAASAAFERHSSENEDVTTRLVQHQTTWGEFAKGSSASQKELKTNLSSVHI